MAKAEETEKNGGKTGPRSLSYLIRFWPEPREGGEGEEIWRGYLRDLRTGEEEYLAGPNQLVRLLTSRIRQRAKEREQNESAEASTARVNSD